ncbi:MAG: AAA family ATPase, partial [Gammaproteobacteria bacterium]|nr:AAA family ATPase [Gammaproteobacteria bacterium]
MYLEHFGLSRPPFKITPDTTLFYTGSKRGAALEALKYAIISGEGIIKVVGEVGSGKTMLCRMLEQELPAHVEVVYIANPSLAPENILHVVAFELKLPINNDTSRLTVMQLLHEYLLQKHAHNRQVVVFVEEAQGMPIETLEEIRLLSNLETSDHKLLQMVLFGQPELDEKLRNPSIRQLKERITHSFYLDPFPRSEIYQYLNFRMRAVGYRGPDIFSQTVANNIEKKSQGLTRRINILADKALLAAFSEGGHGIAVKHINIAARDSDFGQAHAYLTPTLRKSMLAGAIVLLVITAVWIGTLIPQANENASPAAVVTPAKPVVVAPAHV